MAMEQGSMFVDYAIFIIFILGSTMIAVYNKYSEPKLKTVSQFAFASAGSVSMGAMIFSIARGTLGVRSFIGYPSELYYRGCAMWETLYGMLLAYPVVAYLFIPVYFSLGINSVYQYLDMRFKSTLVRRLASGTYIVRTVLNLGVTIFTPCVALNTVIGLPYWASIVGITSISVVFTTMGGLKAAILADVLQGCAMILISLIIMVKGSIEANGVDRIYEINRDNGRLDFFNFDLDPTLRVTTTSAIVGQLFMSMSIFGCQQNFVQRYCSMSSEKEVRRTLFFNIPVMFVLFSLSWLVGMVIYAVYNTCDPLETGYIKKIDEILPFFVEDQFYFLPGLLGLFMAVLFNSSLNITVSNLNALATVTWEDFFSHLKIFKTLKDTSKLLAVKLTAVAYGFILVVVSFLVGMLSGVIESSQLLTSATSGPLVGVFLLAMLFPFANKKGAATGVIFGHLLCLFLTIGNLTIDKPPVRTLPVSTEGCTNTSYNAHIRKPDALWPPTSINYDEWDDVLINDTNYLVDFVVNRTHTDPSDFLSQIYSISYMYYSFLGCLATVIVGCVISYVTGTSEEDVYDENMLHPVALKLSRLFPGKPRVYLQSTTRFADECSTKNKTNVKMSEIFAVQASQTSVKHEKV